MYPSNATLPVSFFVTGMHLFLRATVFWAGSFAVSNVTAHIRCVIYAITWQGMYRDRIASIIRTVIKI